MVALLQRFSGYFPALVALALPTLFLTAVSDSFILPRTAIVLTGACLGTGLALLVPRSAGLGALRWPLVAAVAAALLAFAFSISWPLSLTGSYTRYESLPVRLAYLGLLASTVWLIRTPRQREWVIGAFVFGCSVAALEAIQQWAGQAPFRPDGNLGNANLLAALIAMAVPLAIDRGVRGGWFVLAWWAAVFVLGWGLVVTTSRSGALGALAGALTVGVLEIRPKRVAAAAAAVAGVVMAAALGFLLVGPLRALNDDPARLRLSLWRDALRMVAARPGTGWGQDTTGLVFGHYLSQDYASLVTFDRVHSGPLDVAATQGVLGVIALAAVLVVLAAGAWRSRREAALPGLAGAVVGYSVWVLFNFDWAPATGGFWLLAGVLWSATRALPPTTPAAPRWGAAVAVALAVVATLIGVLPVLADAWYERGHSELAVKVDPLQAQYHWTLGDGLIAAGQVEAGVAELRRAADLGETEPGLYVELGDHELQLGDRSAARAAYRRALEIDPYYTPARQRLANLGG